MTIKYWDYWKSQHVMPYGDWLCMNTDELKLVPLSGPCEFHADPEFDAYVSGCRCQEYKFVRRTKEEVEQIKELQKQVRRESILAQADKIRSEQ